MPSFGSDSPSGGPGSPGASRTERMPPPPETLETLPVSEHEATQPGTARREALRTNPEPERKRHIYQYPVTTEGHIAFGQTRAAVRNEDLQVPYQTPTDLLI